VEVGEEVRFPLPKIRCPSRQPRFEGPNPPAVRIYFKFLVGVLLQGVI